MNDERYTPPEAIKWLITYEGCEPGEPPREYCCDMCTAARRLARANEQWGDDDEDQG